VEDVSERGNLGADATADVVTIDGEEEEEEDHQLGSVVAVDGKAGELDLVVVEKVVTVGVTVICDLELRGGRGEMKDHVAVAGQADLVVDGAVGPLQTDGEGEALVIPTEEGATILLSHPRVHGVGVVKVQGTGGGVALALVVVGGKGMSRVRKVGGLPQTFKVVGGEIRVNESEVGVPHAQVAAGVDLAKDQDAITAAVEAGGVGRRSP